MIYLDTSVALAELFAEDEVPPPVLWEDTLVASRLLQYEVWTRLHSRRLAGSHGRAAEDLLARIAFLEMTPRVLSRALEPFPVPVRTLDALHLASIEFLRSHQPSLRLATYDERFRTAARALGVPLFPL